MKRITLCFAFVVQLLLTGCENMPVNLEVHKEPGRDVYKSWAVTGCVANVESSAYVGMDRKEIITLCRNMADLFKKNQCNLPIPVGGSTYYVHP